MPTATLPLVWTGRSGRQYVPVEGARVRHGGMATVRKVVGRGGQVGSSVVPDGVNLALKLWNEGDEASLDQLQREAAILMSIAEREGDIPCPRLYDVVGDPLITALVMEWCAADLGRWWADRLDEPDAFGRLMATMAEVARRVSDYHVFFADRQVQAAHGDLKPSNILLSVDGRWLISDFGTAQVAAPGDDAWDETKKVVATENFLAPEVLFNARKRHPAAIDTWSLGASVFALLRLRRLHADGAELPRNGTHSPRFRTERMNQVHQVYARNPRQFRERDLDPDAFADPIRLPEDDRRAVRDAMRGLLPTPSAEDDLAEALLEVLDRALSIDPAHRYTSCRDLAAAFENLTRTYIQLAATGDGPAPVPRETTEQLIRDRDAEVVRAERLSRENARLQSQLDELTARLESLASTPVPAAVVGPSETPSNAPIGLGLVAVIGLQLVTLVGIAVLAVLSLL
jgi:serine/threonine protein kinase